MRVRMHTHTPFTHSDFGHLSVTICLYSKLPASRNCFRTLSSSITIFQVLYSKRLFAELQNVELEMKLDNYFSPSSLF